MVGLAAPTRPPGPPLRDDDDDDGDDDNDDDEDDDDDNDDDDDDEDVDDDDDADDDDATMTARTAREHEALMVRNMMSNHTCSDRPLSTCKASIVVTATIFSLFKANIRSPLYWL